MNSRKHARLRNIQLERKCRGVMRRLGKFIVERNRPMIEAARDDVYLYGRMGKWSIDEHFVLTYERAAHSAGVDNGD
jgi:hypothetical protein